MKICVFCNNEYESIWNKCDDCKYGESIYTDGKRCFLCKELKIHKKQSKWKSYCNKCYNESIIR